MELTFMCSQMDTDFIEQIYKTFGEGCTIDETEISGITGYEIVMLVIAGATLTAQVASLFVATHMTSSYDKEDIRSKRCIVDKNNRSYSFEGYELDEINSFINETRL